MAQRTSKKIQKKTKKKAAIKPAAADPKAAILDAALNQAELLGWGQVTLGDIAREAGMDLAGLRQFIEDKHDILVLFGRMVDQQTLVAKSAPDPAVSARDQLFDVLMQRFDVLNRYRAPLLSILESFKADPKMLVMSCPHLGRSMCWMLEAAGLETNGLRGAVRVAGLTALYLKTLRVWIEDESADMAKVMAALDKDLGRAEMLANRLGF